MSESATCQCDGEFDYDRVCTRCGGRMVASSTWTANDPDRSWRAVVRYCCEGCAVEGVVTIGRDRPDVYGGFVTEEQYESDTEAKNAETMQQKLVTDGGAIRDGTEHDYDDDEAYCTEFTTDHGIPEVPSPTGFLWAFVCPRCGEKNGLEGDPGGFRNKPFRCTKCNWVSLLVAEEIEEFQRSIDTVSDQ